MVNINQMSFTYKAGSRNVLEKISFDLQNKQCVAILGNNGAGKSTLIKCINRICPAQKGIVLVDGKNVFEMKRNALAQNISYVAQDNKSLNMTVFDAILLGRKPYIKDRKSVV